MLIRERLKCFVVCKLGTCYQCHVLVTGFGTALTEAHVQIKDGLSLPISVLVRPLFV